MINKINKHLSGIDISKIEQIGINLNPKEFDFVYGYPSLDKLSVIKNNSFNLDFIKTEEQIGIYIHIPFCLQMCNFCYFRKQKYNSEIVNDYVNSIINELKSYSLILQNNNVKFIYIGGGTPSILNENQIERISNTIFKFFNINEDYEYSFEASPETLTHNKLISLKQNGITRLSIGIQSFNDNILKQMNRSHDSAMAISSIELALKYFTDTLNIDLIYGYPNSSTNILFSELEIIKRLNIPSITFYQIWLNIKTAISKYFNGIDKYELFLQKLLISDKMNLFSYSRDKSDWFIKNAKSKYRFQNHKWENKPFIGIGISSYAYVNGLYYRNSLSIKDYINEKMNNISLSSYYMLSKDEQKIRKLILGIKLSEGVDLNILNNFSDKSKQLIITNKVNHIIKLNLAKKTNQKLILNDKGLMIADNISTFLMDNKYNPNFNY